MIYLNNSKFLILLFLLCSLSSVAQITATVKNANDQKPIPYVNIWVENENIGVTADENGKFTIAAASNSKLIFNALGYEDKLVKASEINGVVYLIPKVIALGEVVVSRAKKSKENKLGSFKLKRFNSYYGSADNYPYIVARFFPNETNISETPFIKSIMPYCKSDIKDAKFKVRIFEAKKDGLPGNELVNENIIVNLKKGSSKPVIDISKYNIDFPEYGLFIGLEFMQLASNKYDFTASIGNTKEKKKMTSLEPAFGTVQGESEEKETWRLSKGKWYKTTWFTNQGQAGKEKDLLAIELTLTN
jgi:hypothetical protein